MSGNEIRVKVSDQDTGEVLEDRLISDDYVLICAGNHHLHSTVRYANGTTLLTIKVAKP